MRADWMASGACTSGSTAHPRDATRRVSGGAATTSTMAEPSSGYRSRSRGDSCTILQIIKSENSIVILDFIVLWYILPIPFSVIIANATSYAHLYSISRVHSLSLFIFSGPVGLRSDILLQKVDSWIVLESR